MTVVIRPGLWHVANALGCDDENACTTADTCAAKVCVEVHPSCDDGNVCTDDSCDPASGCLNAANVLACDDNNACTVGDVCQATVCQPGPAADCDDDNFCTSDVCSAFVDVKTSLTPWPVMTAMPVPQRILVRQGCTGGIAPNCNDDNPCTDDSCDATVVRECCQRGGL